MSPTSGPTRIAFCITELDPGGAERAFVRLVTGLDRSRWEPFVYCLAGQAPLVEVLKKSDVPVTCLGARGLRDWSVLFRLATEFRKARPSLLQTFLFHANMVGRLAGRRAGIKHIVSGIRVAEKRTRTHLWLDRCTNWLVEQNVCVSQAVAEFSIQQARLNPRKVTVIPNGVDAELFAAACPADLSEWGISRGEPVFISVGRLDPQKGLFYLLEAMRDLLRHSPRAHLLLVGEGNERAGIEAWIAENRLAASIHLAGWRPDIPELLKAATCLVLSSLWEGMPNVLLEAMASGLPIVATRVEGVPELVQADSVQANSNGLLVNPACATELVAAMAQIIGSPDVAQEMGRVGQRRAREEFSWERMIAGYERLYSMLLTSDGQIA